MRPLGTTVLEAAVCWQCMTSDDVNCSCCRLSDHAARDAALVALVSRPRRISHVTSHEELCIDAAVPAKERRPVAQACMCARFELLQTDKTSCAQLDATLRAGTPTSAPPSGA